MKFLDVLKAILRRCNICIDRYYKIINYAQSKPDPGRFYVIPKIHKPTLKSRPITAQHSYMLGQLSQELSAIINEEGKNIPAITVNSKQLARQLETKKFPYTCWFLTYDVARMYPSMVISDSINTLKSAFPDIFLKSAFPDIFGAKKGFWLHVLSLIMYNSYVRVGEQSYLHRYWDFSCPSTSQHLLMV